MSVDPMKDLQRQADEMDRQGLDSSELRSTFAPQTDGLPADEFEGFEETIAKIEASPEYRALSAHPSDSREPLVLTGRPIIPTEPPRRCRTNIVTVDGDCPACLAINGELCKRPIA